MSLESVLITSAGSDNWANEYIFHATFQLFSVNFGLMSIYFGFFCVK